MKKQTFKLLILSLALAMTGASSSSFAHDEKMEPGAENATPKELADVGITEHLGEKVDLGLTFKDEDGKTVALGNFFHSGKPVVLDLAYYACPGLCNYHLNGFSEGLKTSRLTPGKDYEWVVVSFDPREKPDLAKAKKKNMVAAFATTGERNMQAQEGWHFLTGEKANIEALAKQVGFSYHWVEEEKQFAHASAAYIVTPDATISRYLKGVMFDPRTLKLSLMEAQSGAVSKVVSSLILYCFHYDAKAAKFTFAAMSAARILGALTALILFIFIVPNILKKRKATDI